MKILLKTLLLVATAVVRAQKRFSMMSFPTDTGSTKRGKKGLMSFPTNTPQRSTKSTKSGKKGPSSGCEQLDDVLQNQEAILDNQETMQRQLNLIIDFLNIPLPTAPPAVAPTAPVPTPPPTDANSIQIRATNYTLFYTHDQLQFPTGREFAELAGVTQSYLEQFIMDEFSQTSLTNLDDFLTVMDRNLFRFGHPTEAEFLSSGFFNPSSIFLPTVREMNQLIHDAFTGDNMEMYLRMVQSLPSSNMFSTTSNITKSSFF